MESKLQQFQNEEFGTIRVVEIDGNPWWVLRDVCMALGLQSPHKVAERLDEDERNQIPVIDSIGRRQFTEVVNESGLYAVILRSDKPKAKAFRRWITSEVLPSIRKHGAYIDPALLEELSKAQGAAVDFFSRLQSERQKTAALREYVGDLAPKARYCDTILACRNVVPVSVIAKDYGMSAASFNRLLHGLGIQYKSGKTWLLYQRHAGQGYTRTRTYYVNEYTAAIHTYWTQKGRLFLYERLKECGLLPLMEVWDAASGL